MDITDVAVHKAPWQVKEDFSILITSHESVLELNIGVRSFMSCH